MAYRVVMTPEARRNMLALPQDVARRVTVCILALAEKPRPPQMRKLKGILNLWRVRLGDYRVVYQIEDDRLLIVVIRIGHRREVYR
ncbi:MAG: type II toxin-antitoxin system RelE/ParE family toxin [Planctomycetes bacterium]|nr:type II toxin-antitoxin system RelE/ParE family toxin [Planctomycetota bacterium]